MTSPNLYGFGTPIQCCQSAIDNQKSKINKINTVISSGRTNKSNLKKEKENVSNIILELEKKLKCLHDAEQAQDKELEKLENEKQTVTKYLRKNCDDLGNMTFHFATTYTPAVGGDWAWRAAKSSS